MHGRIQSSLISSAGATTSGQTLRYTAYTIGHVATQAGTVIITLDAEDALIGHGVLARIGRESEDGADVTVGSMLRLDKEARYAVNFDRPKWWDGNVWQHLRSFRKRLFDAIDAEDLRMDGEWIELAADWAFMVPIVEMAASPRHIPEPLYLYQPAAPKDDDGRRERDAVVARILDRQPYRKLRPPGRELGNNVASTP